MKTIKTFNSSPAHVKALLDTFNAKESKHGFNLTEHLDKKAKVDFNQDDINEIVLWKVNRYVNVRGLDWFEKFNKLKDNTTLEADEQNIRCILKQMLATNGIQLPVASTMLRFCNPEVFQVIDARTFRIIFGGDDDTVFKEIEKKYNSSKADPRIDVYFEYLKRLRRYCADNKEVKFIYADRIFYQYDIEEKQKLPK